MREGTGAGPGDGREARSSELQRLCLVRVPLRAMHRLGAGTTLSVGLHCYPQRASNDHVIFKRFMQRCRALHFPFVRGQCNAVPPRQDLRSKTTLLAFASSIMEEAITHASQRKAAHSSSSDDAAASAPGRSASFSADRTREFRSALEQQRRIHKQLGQSTRQAERSSQRPKRSEQPSAMGCCRCEGPDSQRQL